MNLCVLFRAHRTVRKDRQLEWHQWCYELKQMCSIESVSKNCIKCILVGRQILRPIATIGHCSKIKMSEAESDTFEENNEKSWR